MLTLNPVFPDFVSGSSTGAGTHFFCKVCLRDVKMVTRGSGEFSRYFRSDGHWFKDVTYRVHMGLQIYNRLLEPMTLTEAQRVEYGSRPIIELAEGFPFPEDLAPEHASVESRIPFSTLVSCVGELLRSGGGGDFCLLRRLWGHFRATLEERDPVYNFKGSRTETVVSCL